MALNHNGMGFIFKYLSSLFSAPRSPLFCIIEHLETWIFFMLLWQMLRMNAIRRLAAI
jgi:hypothetical protein